MPTYNILQGDSLEVLRTLDSETVNTCVTSPPYWGLRDYGVPGQLGLEKTPELYVAKMVEVFREVRRVLKADGTLWLNLGDSYAGSWGNYGGQNRGKGTQREIGNGSQAPNPAYDGLEQWRPPASEKIAGIKPKDLCGIPWLVAFALRTDGWYLRSDIIWHKPNVMPSSVRDRCTTAHEYIFMLSKSKKYYFDADAIAEPAKEAGVIVSLGAKSFSRGQAAGANVEPSGNGLADTYEVKQTRNKRSVWTVTTKPYKGAHFATFPPDLIEPCILAGSPKNGLVLDPFAGSGTTGQVALKHNRNFLGIELNPDYIKLAHERIGKQIPQEVAHAQS